MNPLIGCGAIKDGNTKDLKRKFYTKDPVNLEFKPFCFACTREHWNKLPHT